MKVYVYLTFLSTGIAAGFLLLDGKNNQTSGMLPSNTDMTVQYLLGLIVDEKNSRHQLENSVMLMSDKIGEMEIKMTQKETEFESKLTKTNLKVSHLENYNIEVSRLLKKEQNNRQYLGQMNMLLEERLNNITKEYEKLKTEIVETDNFTNLRLKNLSDCCVTTSNDVKQVEETVANITNGLMFTEKKLFNMSRDVEYKAEYLERVSETGLNKTFLEIENIKTNMSLSLQGRKSVGFTVKHPNSTVNASAEGNNVLRFGKTMFDSGDGYSSLTGMFTCRYPGLYFFTASIYKDDTVTESYCYLYIKGKQVVRIFANSNGSTSSYSSSSSSVVDRLSQGDTVYLAECSPIDKLFVYETTFSGFMITQEF